MGKLPSLEIYQIHNEHNGSFAKHSAVTVFVETTPELIKNCLNCTCTVDFITYNFYLYINRYRNLSICIYLNLTSHLFRMHLSVSTNVGFFSECSGRLKRNQLEHTTEALNGTQRKV